MKYLQEDLGFIIGFMFGLLGWEFIYQGREWWLIVIMFVCMFTVYFITHTGEKEQSPQYTLNNFLLLLLTLKFIYYVNYLSITRIQRQHWRKDYCYYYNVYCRLMYHSTMCTWNNGDFIILIFSLQDNFILLLVLTFKII